MLSQPRLFGIDGDGTSQFIWDQIPSSGEPSEAQYDRQQFAKESATTEAVSTPRREVATDSSL